METVQHATETVGSHSYLHATDTVCVIAMPFNFLSTPFNYLRSEF